MLATLKIPTIARRAAGAVVTLLLAGCSAQSLAPTGNQSWMASDALRKQRLLYVSDDATNGVYVYSYPQGNLEGTLTGFSFPEGECVDKKGDVFIANDAAQNVLEYAHGGTTPIQTLNDSGYFPVGCSVDPTTGNLAVANTYNSGFTGGGVAIYKNATGLPTLYKDTGLVFPRFCGYDAQGNLYADGFNSAFSLAFAEIPKGSSGFTDIFLNQSIGFPGQVQWDGKYVAVGDEDTNTIYQFIVSGDSGSKIGSTPLNGAHDVPQFWVAGSKVLGPDTPNADVGFWSYPAGGSEVKTLSGLSRPFGATISK